MAPQRESWGSDHAFRSMAPTPHLHGDDGGNSEKELRLPDTTSQPTRQTQLCAVLPEEQLAPIITAIGLSVFVAPYRHTVSAVVIDAVRRHATQA